MEAKEGDRREERGRGDQDRDRGKEKEGEKEEELADILKLSFVIYSISEISSSLEGQGAPKRSAPGKEELIVHFGPSQRKKGFQFDLSFPSASTQLRWLGEVWRIYFLEETMGVKQELE